MSNATATTGSSPRWKQLFVLSLKIALACAGLAVGDSLSPMLYSFYDLRMPYEIRPYIRLASVALVALIFIKQPARIGFVKIPEAFWTRSQTVCGILVNRALAIVCYTSIVLMMILWLPHFLNWPWWADMDHFGLAALSWDVGRLPYRDQLDFNFPGPMFLMWILGKVFGWGRSMPPLAVDAVMLIGLGVAMVAWSRQRFGNPLPGLVGFTLFTCYYLSLNASLVAQRDWQATWMVVLSLMTIEAVPNRRVAWPLAAFLVALSFTFRPYAVLFLPAFLSAIDERVRPPGESIGKFVRGLAWFGLVFGFMLALVYSPLWIAGILDDFLRSLAYVVPGGTYNQNSANGFRTRLFDEATKWQVDWLLVPLAWLAFSKTDRLGRAARTWGLAVLCAVFYRPIGPVAHHYLVIPLQLIVCFGVVVILTAILTLPAFSRPSTKFLSLLVILAWFFPGIPRYCSLLDTKEALALDFLGRPPTLTPIGLDSVFLNRDAAPLDANWEDYSALLDYLRTTTTKKTMVANTLRKHPYPALNGPTGRLSPYPSAANMVWFRWVGTAREPDYCRALAKSEDSVVVWIPGERTDFPWMRVEELVKVVREYYRPEAKFGVMEVWRRIPKGTTPEPLPPYIPEELEKLKKTYRPPSNRGNLQRLWDRRS